MTLSGFYLGLSIFNGIAVLCALIQARRLYFMLPVYFMLAWPVGEMAFILLGFQVATTVVVGFFGGLVSAGGQLGLLLFALSWMGMLYLHRQSMDSAGVFSRALATGLGNDYRQQIPAPRRAVLRDHIESAEWTRPFKMPRPGVVTHRNLSYGDAGERNLLDVYQPAVPREGGFPILLQVHGGAWMIGNKQQQALPLMYHLAQRGWLCVTINYRLSPKHAFPEHIIDVKKAIAWIREHAMEYGGNAGFLAITGGSAGGHLSSLAALTPNKPEWQPGFEDVDTSVDAAVPIYGVYDFTDRDNIRGDMAMESTLSKHVMQTRLAEDRESWEDASPLSHVSDQAPPMFVLQGTHDSLVWVEEARNFVAQMQSHSNNAVVYAELPGAQHAYEIFHSVRTDYTVNAVTDFLEWSYAQHEVKG
ncbi:alpha/beta hydrolase [Halieaceae bacterium IMCC14734]|uniref:Alpha/beta hydrolase n=1 Tax=Candidatus Litorirhabdus singularis TaxID=2518993 RepID=A0ABT3TCL9_9GAMM|nr:alpha/beta hydrolase [Candidatus Litorirhabdus singularis]MCX2980050.1 alpha/beta hydrolase [Candidatus Litorirhabdus singularis]